MVGYPGNLIVVEPWLNHVAFRDLSEALVSQIQSNYLTSDHRLSFSN